MAAAIRSQARKQPKHIREIAINGRIPKETRCKLVKDILKFILFHRDQIPLPFEQLKYYFDKQENIKKGSEATKLGILLDGVRDVCTNLDHLFQADIPVESLLILLGPTVATPKEIFRIEFSSQVVMEPLARVTSAKMCSRLLHRSLVTYNALIDAKPPSVTSLHILFQGQRSVCSPWFQPKHNFKVPKRGQYFTFQILSTVEKSLIDQREAWTRAEEELGEVHCCKGHQEEGSGRGSPSHPRRQEDLIWYAAPKPIKGVRDTVLSVPQQGDSWVL